MSKEKLKQQKGITLIALIITIIVMLILVGVSVTVATKGNLFGTAKTAAEGTEARKEEELAISEGKITIGTYNSIEEYIGSINENYTGLTIKFLINSDIVEVPVKENQTWEDWLENEGKEFASSYGLEIVVPEFGEYNAIYSSVYR